MKNKKLLKYIFMYLPFVIGIMMFSFGTVNLFSSLLLFLGGYSAVKGTFNKKFINNMEKKRINEVREPIKVRVEKKDISKKAYIKPINPENIVGVKRTRVYKKVRRIR